MELCGGVEVAGKKRWKDNKKTEGWDSEMKRSSRSKSAHNTDCKKGESNRRIRQRKDE